MRKFVLAIIKILVGASILVAAGAVPGVAHESSYLGEVQRSAVGFALMIGLGFLIWGMFSAFDAVSETRVALEISGQSTILRRLFGYLALPAGILSLAALDNHTITAWMRDSHVMGTRLILLVVGLALAFGGVACIRSDLERAASRIPERLFNFGMLVSVAGLLVSFAVGSFLPNAPPGDVTIQWTQYALGALFIVSLVGAMIRDQTNYFGGPE